MNDKIRVFTIGAACFLSLFPQISMAQETFKSSEFLSWDRDNQEFYIRTSVGMASLIIAQTDEQDSRCIDTWYTSDMDAAHQYIFEQMRRFPSYHPRGVILAVMEKKCGKFTYNP